MKLFIDSADPAIIKTAFDHGLVHGVTTNPALVAKEPPHTLGYYGHLRDIVRVIGQDTPISVQPSISELNDSMVEHIGTIQGHLQSRKLIIKIAASWENLPLIRAVSRRIPVNATCIFTAEQAIAAMLAGASFVSFFWCRMNDAAGAVVRGESGYSAGGGQAGKAVHQVRSLIDASNMKVEIIAGSIRTPADAMSAFAAGAHIVTTGLPVLQAMATSNLSNASAEGFEKAGKDWSERSAVFAAEEEARGREAQFSNSETPADA